MTDQLAAERYRSATFSVAIFFGAVFYLGYVSAGFNALVSLDGVMFLLVGALVSGGVGLAFFRFRLWLAGILEGRFRQPPDESEVRRMKMIATALLTTQVVATWLLAEYLYRWFVS